MVDRVVYSQPSNPNEITDKIVESHQQIWDVVVDVGKGEVVLITQDADRVIRDTIRSNIIRADVNMFLPQ
jgi:hypothetical protein